VGITPIITVFKFVICDDACATKPLLISFRSLNSSAWILTSNIHKLLVKAAWFMLLTHISFCLGPYSS